MRPSLLSALSERYAPPGVAHPHCNVNGASISVRVECCRQRVSWLAKRTGTEDVCHSRKYEQNRDTIFVHSAMCCLADIGLLWLLEAFLAASRIFVL